MLNKRILVLMLLLAFLFLAGCIPSPAPPIADNQAPIITSTPVTTATVGVIYYYDVEATDPEVDTLTYSLIAKPAGMIINSVNGLVSWVPTAKGNYVVIVEASDGALSDTQSFTVVVKKPYVPPCPPVNHAPVITSDPVITAEIGVEYIYNVETFDEDGDIITYSLATPTGMTINSITGVISWIPCSTQVGDNDVTVEVSDGKKNATQSFVVVVEALPIVIDGILDLNEWDKATVIDFAGGKGVAKVLATVDYLYVAFDIVDPTDNRLAENLCGNDKLSININPTDGGPWGKPYDLVFQTGTDPAAFTTPDPDILGSSGLNDGYETEWCIVGIQLSLPGDLETKTLYGGGNRVTEWKLPLVSIALACGDQIKVGGNADLDVPLCIGYTAPATLNWADPFSTCVDIVVY